MKSHRSTRVYSLTGRATHPHLRVAEIFAVLLITLTLLKPTRAESGIQTPPGVQSGTTTAAACKDPTSPSAVREALRLVCTKDPISAESIHEAVIICFLGGFVKANDGRHPEVWFAKYLRARYGPAVHVWVFGNRDEPEALRNTVEFVTAGRGHGPRTAPRPAVIVYGHSWGGSQVLTFAKDLDRNGISVALTIQIDSVRKFRHDGHTVPRNVSRAINFYQTRGMTPGERHIVPADPAKTVILGNLQMNYDHVRIDCSNYKWLSRAFNKPHHQIENDPRVWSSIASLIHMELTAR